MYCCMCRNGTYHTRCISLGYTHTAVCSLLAGLLQARSAGQVFRRTFLFMHLPAHINPVYPHLLGLWWHAFDVWYHQQRLKIQSGVCGDSSHTVVTPGVLRYFKRLGQETAL